MKVLYTIFGFSLFLVILCLGYQLLGSSKISGSEFITLIIAFAIIGLIISFTHEVQEFSIAGNTVKLREVRREAEKTIEDLNAARTEIFRLLFSLIKRQSGEFSSINKIIDDRFNDFTNLYNKVKEFKCEAELKNEILETLESIIENQYALIAKFVGYRAKKYSETINPADFRLQVFNENLIQDAANRNICSGSIEKIEQKLNEGLETYQTMYDLRKNLSS